MEAVPQSLFSRDYDVLENSRKIADIDMAWWGERADVLIDNTTYKIDKQGFIKQTFSLLQGSQVLATARKESLLSREYVVEIGGTRYYLKRKSWLHRAMSLSNDITSLGVIRPRGFLKRGTIVDLPEEITLPVKVFVIWLVLLLWRREKNNNAAGSDSG
ncbi:MAG: hypothetical protein OXU24_00545 [Gammaproteobacteria bacterium]|nr:hypothetical protein [Gammaproteobacteria bacterium]